ncbi:dimethylarginine dimethylaminohydrolase family protein [Alkalihalobacillus sp. CinArs1]|uniref:dimethylarginine dimethylaminohydrolase family protein n=1 Tax=Alkalihalobacillus sp. CinArs1 TaxID=2995314 RepID=UPI0022DE1430|nr:arginine deiminase family protein [Alkalihalobacillus sp. CinArs1]
MKTITANKSVRCATEYDALNHVLVVKPSFMKITEIINETQKHYEKSNINVPLALKQHENFVSTLKENGVNVSELPTDPHLPEQVFTRDIGFTINDELFVGTMNERVRRSETNILKTWLSDRGIGFQEGLPGSIEGGDVVVDGSTIWIGVSGRTTKRAIDELQRRLPTYRIEAIQLTEDILHLDCVFNIVSKDTALVYREAFTKEGLKKISARFQSLIEVTKEEQFEMGPNVLSIGNDHIVSLPQNERLNAILRSKGFHVITVDFSEIIKSGGSFRCCTLPLVRR